MQKICQKQYHDTESDKLCPFWKVFHFGQNNHLILALLSYIVAFMTPLTEKERAERPFTTEETAEYFRVSLRTVQRWIADGTIKALKVGGVWRISRAEINRLMGEGNEK